MAERPLGTVEQELADLRTVIEHMPSEEDGTATVMEVAQRRSTALGYLERATKALTWRPPDFRLISTEELRAELEAREADLRDLGDLGE